MGIFYPQIQYLWTTIFRQTKNLGGGNAPPPNLSADMPPATTPLNPVHTALFSSYHQRRIEKRDKGRPWNRSSRSKRSIRGNLCTTRSINSTFAESFDSARLGSTRVNSDRLDRLGRYTGPPTGIVYTHQTVTVSGRRYKSIVMLCTVLCFRVILALLFHLTLVTVV